MSLVIESLYQVATYWLQPIDEVGWIPHHSNDEGVAALMFQ